MTRIDGSRPTEGRPSTFTQELADRICEEITLGKSLRSICSQDDMPALSTIFKWFRENKEFLEQYARAKEEQADTLTDDMEDIAKDPKYDVQRARLIIDTRKWAASKLKPKKYGDRLEVDNHHTGNVTFINDVPRPGGER